VVLFGETNSDAATPCLQNAVAFVHQQLGDQLAGGGVVLDHQDVWWIRPTGHDTT
jgi:hypothetical protein